MRRGQGPAPGIRWSGGPFVGLGGDHADGPVGRTEATAAPIGLSGQDLALGRTAAIRWVPRRAAHALLCGAVVGTVLLTVQAMGEDMTTTAFVVRDSPGLMGLVALSTTISGGEYA
ncbi:hypothetical protein [Streptomyces sp. NPDC048710]|uniref:hypothetical protein n=1 Tax=Streptomyces sp. NPDC048710 TaxID=3365586 RepID=UPI003722C991